MKFTVTKKDLEDNPILVKRGYQEGDIADTTWFVSPLLKLRPTPQQRVEIAAYSHTKKDGYVEPTLEETFGEVAGPKQEVKEPEEKKVVTPKKKFPTKKK